jgi:hypothetical protein
MVKGKKADIEEKAFRKGIKRGFPWRHSVTFEAMFCCKAAGCSRPF